MGQATEKCRNAVMVLGFTHPHFLLIHSKIRDLYSEVDGGNMDVPTMGITATGKITLNPDYVMNLDREELGGVMAHEMLHLMLYHHDRRGGRDSWVWNIATDMCINNALKQDNVRLPHHVVYPPYEYKGDLFAETLYDWLQKHPEHVPPRPKGVPLPGAGCSPLDDTNGGAPDWRHAAAEARAMAQQAGRGNSGGVSTLLSPRQAKIDWRKIIRTGFQRAVSRPGRDYQTFARKHRRSPAEGAQFPGWQGVGPKIAISVDVSGSMDRKWLERIASECKNLLKQFPGTRCYLNAHTCSVVWNGWITDTTKTKIDDAMQFSGGTDPTPAYIDIKEQGKFDSMIHFTDCEFFNKWPDPPARHLIVGAFTREPYTKPPAGSTVILCDLSE